MYNRRYDHWYMHCMFLVYLEGGSTKIDEIGEDFTGVALLMDTTIRG